MNLNQRTLSIIHILFIIILGALIYSNSLNGPFQFDDRSYIENNYTIRSFPDLSQNIKRYGWARYISFYTFALNYKLHGLETFGYHLVNICIHIINGILLWWFLGLILNSPKITDEKIKNNIPLISLSSAVLFMAHPIQTQAVAYIWQRQASLATLFYLLSVCLYVKARYSNIQIKQIAFFMLTALTALCAMFTKQITFTLPLAIILIEYFFFYKKEGYDLDLKFLLPVLGAAFLIIPSFHGFDIKHILMRPSIEPGAYLIGEINSWNYLLTQFRVVVRYITLILLPIGQNIDHHFTLSTSIFDWRVLGSMLIWASIITYGWRARKRLPLISFGILWFFITILVESSIIPIKHVIFEHRMYLPSIGWTLIITVALIRLLNNKRNFTVIFTGLIILLSILSFQRNKVWQDRESLWLDAINKAPQNPRPYYNLGYTYMKEGNINAAIEHYTKALELKPDYLHPLNNRSNLYIAMGKDDLALNDLDKAIKAKPNMAFLYNTRGTLYQKKKEYDRAIVDFTKGIELDPQAVGAYNNRGACYGQKGLNQLALNDLNKAIEIDPNFPESYNNRGAIHLNKRAYKSALNDFNKAIQLDNRYVDALYNRAVTFINTNNNDLALPDFIRILKIEPDNLKVMFSRGKIYQQKEEYELALNDFNNILAKDPKSAPALKHRAFTYMLMKDYQKALADYNKIIDIDPGLAQVYVERAKLYYRTKQYRHAMEDFRLAETFDPQNGEIYFLRALVEYELKEFQKAVDDLNRAKDKGIEVDDFYFEEFKKALKKTQ